jgi:nucleoside-diphosphate-sugar epimerase
MNFLHVNDVVSGILRVCEDSSSTNVFELSSNYNFTLPLILEQFEKVFSKKIPCRWYSKEPLCYMKEKWNIAPTPTGWKETISLELGLSNMKKDIV